MGTLRRTFGRRLVGELASTLVAIETHQQTIRVALGGARRRVNTVRDEPDGRSGGRGGRGGERVRGVRVRSAEGRRRFGRSRRAQVAERLERTLVDEFGGLSRLGRVRRVFGGGARAEGRAGGAGRRMDATLVAGATPGEDRRGR